MIQRAGAARRLWVTGACIALALATGGCGKLDRVAECRTLARTVNPTFDTIEALVKKRSYEGYRDASKAYKALAETIRKQPHAARGMPELAGEYADLLAEVEPSLAAYATTVRDSDDRGRDNVHRDLERLTRRERTLVTRISAYCGGR